jgi:anaerobic magnesium-protoporphyrin IX monomethyl ester cyclase
MKIAITYPPLTTRNASPILSQSRHFQYYRYPIFHYPIVPASAATLLKQAGFEVIWNDCIAMGCSYDNFLEFIKQEKPDLVVIETKTPAVKYHWHIIDRLKEIDKHYRPKTVLLGDHVTALPEESMRNCKVDFVITGGDYDFLLLNLSNYLDHRVKRLESGIWFREDGNIKSTGRFRLNHNLDDLPFIDRTLTKWQLYAYKNAIYKRLPGTYIMSARDCWRPKCTFCSWPTLLYPNFRTRKVENVLDEIGMLIERYKIYEIMDDSGTFPVGDWLREFCYGMVERRYNKKIYFDCNFCFNSDLFCSDYELMRKAGFRLLVIGLESANQNTLNRINKNLTIEQIIESFKMIRAAGLHSHICIMFGFPWENHEDALRTLKLARYLLKKGYALTVQASIVIPYPGTPLFEECRRKNLLRSYDWQEYDMKQPIARVQMMNKKVTELVSSTYKTVFNPEFIFRKFISIRDRDDIRYFFRAARRAISRLLNK